ncbi:MAG: LysM peptidoglycan-binding domain-containing protein [Verrucomicrobia bacterium]|nr:LysM peptidoglycan-binding domain-containing protein [Verrucomicrobiota bacterium]
MKPFHFLLLVSLVLMPAQSFGQSSAAEAALERKANEERFARLNATVMNLTETENVLRSRIQELEQQVASLRREISRLKDDSSHATTRLVTIEQFNALVEKLKEVDRKREEDNRLIVNSLNSIKDIARPPATVPSHPKPTTERAEVGETVDYKVQKGDLLFKIIAAYNEEFAKQGRGRINEEQVKEVNPDLNPNRIREGQVIRIPLPKKK